MQHCHHQNDAALSLVEGILRICHTSATCSCDTSCYTGDRGTRGDLAEGKKREKIPNATLLSSERCCIQMGSHSIA